MIRRGVWTDLGLPIPLPYTVFTGVLALSALYGVLVYPILPVAAGGSLPIPVKLVMDNDKIPIIEQLLPIEFGTISTTGKIYLTNGASSQ